MSSLASRIYATVKDAWIRQTANYQETHQHLNQPESLFRFKVVSAIVLEDTESDSLQVLTFGTGTKSIVDETYAEAQDGTVVLDCHAEVIARRAFKRLLAADMKEPTNRRLLESFYPNWKPIRYRLQGHLKLHLFISRAPCGSAQKPLNARNGDSLRTFTCDSEADPIAGQRDDIREDTREFYTCSDKVAMWGVAGLQGGLLGRSVEPIYLDSVTIRCHTEEEVDSLKWALGGRIKGDELEEALEMSLGHGALRKRWDTRIGLHIPRCLGISVSDEAFYEAWTGSKAKSDSSSLSHNWISTQGWEFIDSANGRVHVLNDPRADQREKAVSRLSKKSLLEATVGPNVYDSYFNLKAEATEYQSVKAAVRATFETLGLGTWARRDPIFEYFSNLFQARC